MILRVHCEEEVSLCACQSTAYLPERSRSKFQGLRLREGAREHRCFGLMICVKHSEEVDESSCVGLV